MKVYGLKLGTAYQIYDDCLDIAGTEEKAGKTLGSDLRKGKLTLPVLYLLQMVEPDEHHRFSEVLIRSNADELDTLAEEVSDVARSVERSIPPNGLWKKRSPNFKGRR